MLKLKRTTVLYSTRRSRATWRPVMRRWTGKQEMTWLKCKFLLTSVLLLQLLHMFLIIRVFFFLCCSLDMTQELLDYLEAGLKMSETGESTGRRLSLHNQFFFCVNTWIWLWCFSLNKFCVSWTPTGPNLRLQPDSADWLLSYRSSWTAASSTTSLSSCCSNFTAVSDKEICFVFRQTTLC